MARPTARIIREYAGGPIIGMIASTVYVNGIRISVVGDNVEAHGVMPHDFPIVATGSLNTFAHNSNVARLGDLASCGHGILKGSETVFTN